MFGGPDCDPAALASASSWATGTCLKWNATAWNIKWCNNSQVQTLYCTDSQCKNCPQVITYPLNQCGSISTGSSGQGIYFGCIVAPEAPKLPNGANNVLNQYTYFTAGCQASNATVYQLLSYASGACMAGERRTCDGGGAQFQTPCTGAAQALSLGSCVSTPLNGEPFYTESFCDIAVAPTPPPSNPDQPPQQADASNFTSCETAKTRDECIGAVLCSDGKYTLPPTGLLNKCCVWCGSESSGQCRSPSFNTQLCTCPLPGSFNVSKLAQAYGCDVSKTFSTDCKCTGKPVGAPYCVGASGLSAFAALVIVFVLSALSL